MEDVSMDRLKETLFIPRFLWQELVNRFRFAKNRHFERKRFARPTGVLKFQQTAIGILFAIYNGMII